MRSELGASVEPATAAPDFLAGGGEMGALMRAKDWSDTPLGPPGSWPQSLRTAVSILLNSRYPMFLFWGRELVKIYNDGYRSIPGDKHPWALGRPGPEVWPEIWDTIGPMVERVIDHGEATFSDDLLLFMHRHGYPEEVYFTFSYSPIRDESGGIGGMFCACTETTAKVLGERRMRTLHDLATAAAKARNVESACRAAIAVLADNPADVPFALLCFVNDDDASRGRVVAATGLAADEAAAGLVERGLSLPQLVASGRAELVTELSDRFPGLAAGPWPEPPQQALALPLLDPAQNRAIGALILGISSRRALDADYRGFFELVASQVASSIANARAAEDERRRAEALAELDRAKTAFFSNVSHEFRTPLTLLLGPLEEVLAGRDGIPPEQAARIEVAHRNGLRLLKLVNALLDFSRIEAGRVEASFEPTDLARLTAEVAASFSTAVEDAGLRLVVRCEPLPEPVYLDRDMWEKVVLNLLSNAFKFTLEGEIAVAVRPSADGRAAELVVRDTGTGIPAAELPRLFERFHRVAGARGRTFEGSGIGLALVQELVNLHGGAITVESEPGRGSSFTVAVPFGSAHLPPERVNAARLQPSTGVQAQAFVEEALRWLPDEARDDAVAPAPAGAEGAAGTVGRVGTAAGRRILLADDNADMRRYIRRLLLAEGYAVDAVADGRTALASARRQPPDLVLADVMMPGLDGFGLLEALRNEPALRALPVLLLSARAGEEARVEGLSAGAADYLTKPFSARELLARVANNLELARIRQENERVLREEARTLEALNRVGAAVAAELDLKRAVQLVTDAATELSGAAFGAFFYNMLDERGEAYMLHTVSGAAREAFADFPMPRDSAVFAETFSGTGIVRSDDITLDPRYGRNQQHQGMPEGHLPVRSYLAVPVISRSGEVLGGLFLGHPEAGVFAPRAERMVAEIASHAASSIDNARLYRAAQAELAERRQIEAALRESETRFRTMADHAPVMVWVTNAAGACTYLSRNWYEFSGQTEATALGFGWLDAVHPDDRGRTRDTLLSASARQAPFRLETRLRAADGSYRWTIDVATPRFGEDGAFLGYVGSVLDITERKQVEDERERLVAALSDLTDTLEERVAQRTAEIARANRELLEQIEERERIEEALRQAQKMEIIGQLTGGVAHDFNNLLTIIIGNVETLLRQLERAQPDPARLKRSAGHAIRGAERAAALTQRLLAFSRRQPLDPEPVDVNRLVSAMSDLLRRTLGEQVAVETVLAGGLWRTHIDPNQLESAILNLAINARDAMPDGGRLTIETANAQLDERYTARQVEVAPGDYVVVAVSDSGIGMSREVVARAFEPFFTTKGVGQGTGLGLSQVYGFVKQSGGHVKLYSEPGDGTSAKIYLPRLLGHAEESAPPERPEPAPADGLARTILVVEDDEDVRRHSSELLEELGYRVIEAANAQAALEVLDRRPEVAMLFTDIGLPGGMNGRELADEARRRRPELVVLYTTGYAKNAIVHDGRLDPGVQLVTKPFSYAALAAKVRELLDRAAAPPCILLVEDEALVRMVTVETLRDLGFRVEEAATATEALGKVRLLGDGIDAAIVDIGLPDRRGDALAVELRAMLARLPIVMATGYDGSVRAGLKDDALVRFLGKPYDSGQMAEVLRQLGVRARG